MDVSLCCGSSRVKSCRVVSYRWSGWWDRVCVSNGNTYIFNKVDKVDCVLSLILVTPLTVPNKEGAVGSVKENEGVTTVQRRGDLK